MKCGKTWGYLNKIEQNTTVNIIFTTYVHVTCTITFHQENTPQKYIHWETICLQNYDILFVICGVVEVTQKNVVKIEVTSAK